MLTAVVACKLLIGLVVAGCNYLVSQTDYPPAHEWGDRILLRIANVVSILPHADSPQKWKLPLVNSKPPADYQDPSVKGGGKVQAIVVGLTLGSLVAFAPACAGLKAAANVAGSGACALEPLLGDAADIQPMVEGALPAGNAPKKLGALEVIHGVDAVICAVWNAVSSWSQVKGAISPERRAAIGHGNDYLKAHGVTPATASKEAPVHFGLLNQSPAVSDDDMRLITAGLNYLGRRYALAWGTDRLQVEWLRGFSRAPAGVIPLAIFEHPGPHEAGVLGLHDRDGGGAAWAKVFRPFFPAMTLDEAGQGDSLLEGLGHEMLEIAANPAANRLAEGPFIADDGTRIQQVNFEICDPVQGSGFKHRIGAAAVSLPNFVLPAWFIAESPGPWDELGLLRKPLSILPPEGYVTGRYASGQPAVLAARMQAWRRAHKRIAGRSARLGIAL